MEQESLEIGLSVALDRTAGQMRDLHKMVKELEPALLGVLQNCQPGPHLQTLDLLIQSLECLSMFLEDLAAGTDPNVKVDLTAACRRIVLRNLYNALALAEPPDKPVENGEAEFFNIPS